MESKEKSLIILLLLTTLFKGIVWTAFVPLWHTPDEQAHFAQVQYYAENRKGLSGDDLSQEVFESERLLGTLRDSQGNNLFTYHPQYNIEYTDSSIGKYERQLQSIPLSARTVYIKKEAAGYPPLFYILSALGYTTAQPFDLFVRLSFTRMISVFLAVATVWASFLLSRSIFPKRTLLSIATASLVSFQPMFTFVTAGVNNDNLLNLLTTVLLWLLVDSLRKGMTATRNLAMFITLALGFYTKQLIYPFIPLPLLVVIYDYLKKKKGRILYKNIFFIALILAVAVILLMRLLNSGYLPGWPMVNPQSPMVDLSLSTYLKQKLPVLYSETLPWYWGVFKWLGVVLPLTVLRVIKIVLAVSLFGLVHYFLTRVWRKKFTTTDWQLMLLIFSSLWFGFWLLLWDYMLVRSIGFSHGIQGRYFFPNISAHMTLVVFGLWQLLKKYQRIIVKASVLAGALLNFIALKTVLVSYYSVSPISTLLKQASQYKPWFFKGGGLIVVFVIYLTFLINFLYSLIAFHEENKQKNSR